MFALRTQGALHGCTFENNSATFNGMGGAVSVGQGAKLRISGVAFRGNAAHGDSKISISMGGALLAQIGASVEISETLFEANSAKGTQTAEGGALFIYGNVVLRHGVVFRSNKVSGQGDAVTGGAVSVRQGTPVTPPSLIGLESPSFVSNAAEGTGPEGGALFLTADVANAVNLTGAEFSRNVVQAIDTFGKGGAVHVANGGARLENCSFTANAALVEGGLAYDATGGGISVSAGGRLAMIGARMSSNRAGGTQSHLPSYAPHWSSRAAFDCWSTRIRRRIENRGAV